MNFKGRAERLKDTDLPMHGHKIGVGEDEIHAVLDVECRGSGFDAQGRPAMLFEPHIFYRELSPSQRDIAVRRGLARKRWKRDYPKDSYPRLARAMAINESAALRSASWGLGQVMGFNCELAGYPTAKDMVFAFMESEGNQLGGMITFIKNAGLDDELRAHDWHGFARGYNGKSYASHGYHTKLARAYAKWAKIKDTPWTPQATETPQEPNGLAPATGWAALISVILAIFRRK